MSNEFHGSYVFIDDIYFVLSPKDAHLLDSHIRDKRTACNLTADHRQPKLNIRELLNHKDLYGNTTDLCKMVETNIVFVNKINFVSTCILCHLPAFQADSKRFR